MKKKILAVLLIGAMALNLNACGSADSKPEKKEEKSESNDKLEEEKNLLSVEVTLPASLVGDSAAELDQEAKDAGVKEITKNEDGSITMKMTKSAHKTLLSTFKT